MDKIQTQFTDKKWRVMAKKAMALLLVFVMLLGDVPVAYATGDTVPTDPPSVTEAPAETEATEATEASAETEPTEATEPPAETEVPEEMEVPTETEPTEATEATEDTAIAPANEAAGDGFYSDTAASLPESENMKSEYPSVTVENGGLDIAFNEAYHALHITGKVYVEGNLTVVNRGTQKGDFTVDGDLVVGGNLILENCTLTLAEGSHVYVEGSISFQASAVEGGAYLGFARVDTLSHTATVEGLSGEKLLNMADTAVNGTAVIGVPGDCAAVVTLSGIPTGAGYALYADYPITYSGVGAAEAALPRFYRVRRTGEELAFAGLHMDGGIQPENRLPGYAPLGYVFQCWTDGKSDTAIEAVPEARLGQAIALSARLEPKEAAVRCDLGYTPDVYTNDDPAAVLAQYAFDPERTYPVAESLTLPIPWRMGYEFLGWETGSGVLIAPEPNAAEISCTLDPAWVAYGEEGNVLALEARWEARRYPVKFQIVAPTGSSSESLRIRTGETEQWLTLAAFVEKYGELFTHDVSTHEIEFHTRAQYGSSFAEYFQELGIDCLDIRFEGSIYTFVQWQEIFHSGGQGADGSFVYGPGGFFGASLDEKYSSLTAFEKDLGLNKLAIFQPEWSYANTSIYFSNHDWSGVWSVWISTKDEQGSWQSYVRQTPADNKLADIPAGARIQLRAAANSTSAKASFGLWTLTAGGSAISAKEVEGYVTDDGTAYLAYYFTMPAADLNAGFVSTMQVNLKYSPVTEATISLNGRERDGFWTSERLNHANPLLDTQGIDGYGNDLPGTAEISAGIGYCNGEPLTLRYFYEYPKSAAFYVTTGDSNTDYPESVADIANGINTAADVEGKNGTQNQLYCYAYNYSRNVYLVDCHLWATSDFSTAGNPTRTNANIYVDRDEYGTHGPRFYIRHKGDNNIIGSIYFSTGDSGIRGVEKYDALRVGAVRGASYLYMSNTTFLPYDCELFPDTCTYLYNCGQPRNEGTTKDSRIMLPHKSISGGQSLITFDYIHVKSISGNLNASNIVILVEGNWAGAYQPFHFSGNSAVIVKGNFTTSYGDDRSEISSMTGSMLLVLGNCVAAPRMEFNDSLVLVNSIKTNQLNVNSGTVIANGFRNLNTGTAARANGDSDFLNTYKAGTRTSTFSGGDIYLMAEYAETDRGTSETVMNTRLSQLLDGIDLKNTQNLTYEEAQALVAAIKVSVEANLESVYEQSKKTNSQNESIVFGSSTGTSSSIALAGANVYSAGRLTFLDATTVSAGIIKAPVISCKQDLTITGGDITATEIGNSASVPLGETGQKRYAKTVITGGTFHGVEKLGAVTLSAAYESSVENHSYVESLSPEARFDTTGIQMGRDIYINYPTNAIREEAYGKLNGTDQKKYIYTIPDSAAECIPLRTTGSPGDLDSLVWTSDSGSFGAPTKIGSTDSYSWTIEDGQKKLTSGYADTLLVGDDLTDGEKVLTGKDHIRLSPYIVIPRDLKIYQDSDFIASVTVKGEAYPALSVGYNTITGLFGDDSLVFTLNRDMTDKVVLWYKDESGIYHNLSENGTVSPDGLTVSFPMPNLDNVELFICDEIPLYLDEYDIEIHQEGFDHVMDNAQSAKFFHYQGGYLIQSHLDPTTAAGHYISFAKGFDNYDLLQTDENGSATDENGYPIYEIIRDDSRKVTLKDVSVSNGSKGLILSTGVYAAVGIEGSAKLYAAALNGAHLELYGKNGDRTDECLWIASTCIQSMQDLCFTDLRMPLAGHTLLINGLSGKTVVFQRCDMTGTSWLDNPNHSKAHLTFLDCNINWGGSFIHGAGNIIMRNTVFRNTGTNDVALGYGGKGHVILDNSKVYGYEGYKAGNTSGLTAQANGGNQTGSFASLTLRNNSVFIDARNYRIDGKTIIESGSKMWVGVDSTGTNAQGRFRCHTLVVTGEGSELRGGYVVCGGYLDGDNKLVLSGTMTVENGGLVSAAELLGGDGGTIHVNGGEISAKYIGTTGQFIKNAAISNPADVYIDHEKVQFTSTVNINGGTVNVLDGGYIGGFDSSVTVTGGTVNAENASLEGSAIAISGASTRLHAQTVTAPEGSVTVSGATGHHFSNPYPDQPDRKHPFVAIVVYSDLLARSITVNDGALVYAQNAFAQAEAGESTSFTVDKVSQAALYTATYGTVGEGNHDDAYNYVPNNENDDQTIWGIQAITITYDIYGVHFPGSSIPDNSDRTFVSRNPNPIYYNFGESGGSIPLQDLTHPYYEFLGWYYADGTKRETINTNLIPSSYARTLYAKWKPKEVVFRVELPAATLPTGTINRQEVQAYLSSNAGALSEDGTRFTWFAELSIPYWEFIETPERYDKKNYQLYSYQITGAQVVIPEEDPVQIGYNTRVTRPMLEAYEALVAQNGGNPEGVALTISLNNLSLTKMVIRFHLNRNQNGLPWDAAFTASSDNIFDDTYTLSADIGHTLSEVAESSIATGDRALTATGYTFKGWSTTPDGPVKYTNEELNSMTVSNTFPTELYAVWEANTYWVKFEIVPYNGTTNAPGIYYFDPDPNGKNPDEEGFTGTISTVDAHGNITGETHQDVLGLRYDQVMDKITIPDAYRAGSIFDGWYYYLGTGEKIKVVTEDDLLSIRGDFVKELFDDVGSETDPAFTLYAHYRDVEVTYDLNGGHWTDGGGDKRSYGAHFMPQGKHPLAAYTGNATGDTFAFLSTDNDRYVANGNAFSDGDYRETLLRSGYTFAGWYTDPACTDGNEIGHTQRFSDSQVYAKWTANTYQVTLYANNAAMEASGASFVAKNGSAWSENPYEDPNGIEVLLTVDEPINLTTAPNEYWPARDTWGTRQAEEKLEPRQLWGFAYAPIDPKHPDHTDYQHYNYVSQALYNAGQLFVKNESDTGGSIFTLPKQVVVSGETVIREIQDLPDGAELSMYAMYRDYALIFMQYYLDENGNETRKMVHAVLFGDETSFRAENLAVPDFSKDFLDYKLPDNYSQVGWFVNTTDVDGEVYSVENMLNDETFRQYTAEAKKLGTHDIVVYGVFVAHETAADRVLTADSKAYLSETVSSQRIAELTVPLNMQPEALDFSITGFAGLELVTSTVLANRVYDNTAANRTVALTLEIIRDGQVCSTHDLLRAGGDLTADSVRGGDVLRLTLYHSHVISQNASFTGDVTFSFRKFLRDGEPLQYLLLDDMKITLVPADYQVNFHANTPAGAEIAENGSFAEAGHYAPVLRKDGSLSASNPFRNVRLPEPVGYEIDLPGDAAPGVQIWYSDAACTRELLRVENGMERFTAEPSFDAEGVLQLYARWKATSYTLTVDATMAGWTVTRDGIPLSEGTHEIPFGTELCFTPQDPQLEPGFVLLNLETLPDQRLEIDIAPETYGVYRWTMPNSSALVTCSDSLDLYLEKDNILITAGTDGNTHYFYRDMWHTWPGSYNILMDESNNTDGSATSNTLTLNGNLAGVDIHLGNLNVTGKDSISLAPGSYTEPPAGLLPTVGTNVTLTLSCQPNGADEAGASQSQLTNILVPAQAALTVDGENGVLHFTPGDQTAAIGQQTGGTGSKILIRNCTLSVAEQGEYTGVWFGGRDTGELTLENVSVTQPAPDNYSLGRYVTYADTVTLTNCILGTDAEPLSEPIYAKNRLNIQGGEIHDKVWVPLNAIPTASLSAIGTENGTTTVTKGTDSAKIKVTYGTAGKTSRLFTGTMLLEDPDAEVVIDNTLVVEMGNGNLVIEQDKAVQGNHTFLSFLNNTMTFSGNYLLLAERTDPAKTAPTLEIKGNAAKTVTVMPKANTVTFPLSTLTVDADTRLNLQTAATQSTVILEVPTVSIADRKALTVNAGASGTVQLADKALENALGTYVQLFGALTSPGDVGGRALDMELKNVSVNAVHLYAENLTLDSSAVTCSESVGSYGAADGSSRAAYVTLAGNVMVNAQVLGALGAQNETYTGVITDGAAVTFAGSLIQDHYRIAYDRLGADFTAPDYTVFRTTQTGMDDSTRTAVGGTIPKAPTGKDGTDISVFNVWYYLNADALYALTQADTVPAGYSGRDILRTGLIACASDAAEDGTRTLTLYAGMKVTGEACIRPSRCFTHLAGGTAITVPANGAWTLSLTVKDALIGGYYKLTFDTALPAGTKLTLVTFQGDVPAYYYAILSAPATELNLSDFAAMDGSGKHPALPGDSQEDRFVVAADFFGADTPPESGRITLHYVYASGDTVELTAVPVYVTVTAVDGSILVNGSQITVAAPTSSVYAGKPLAVVAEFTGPQLPCSASAALGGITGTPLAENRFLFPLEGTQSPFTFTFSEIYGERNIRWSLVAMEPGNLNALGNGIAHTQSSFTNDAPAQPRLSASISDDTGRILAAETEHTVLLNYVLENADLVTVTVEKQQGLLAGFDTVTTGTASEGTAEVTIPGEKGVYRICLSMDNDSDNDNVYFVFVVE